MFDNQTKIPADQALPGRLEALTVEDIHFVNQTSFTSEPSEGCQKILFGMGCFWGAERLFWQLDGVVSTSVGYSGGVTPNPTYDEVCTGKTGHTEMVRVIFDPKVISLKELFIIFWEHHDPTQGMRQGNDLGTQYRSAIYTYNEEQFNEALESKSQYQQLLSDQGKPKVTTEIEQAQSFYFAESYHQQYLAKNPNGYCGLGGTGVCFLPESP